MKISYNMKDSNLFKVLNDSMGVSLYKENILKSRKLKYMKYFNVMFLITIIEILFLSLMLVLEKMYPCFLSLVLVALATAILIYSLIKWTKPIIFSLCFTKYEQGEIEISEKGIAFPFDEDITFNLGWSHIKGIIVGKESLNFVTDYEYYFYLDKKYKKEVEEAVKAYNKSLIIVK